MIAFRSLKFIKISIFICLFVFNPLSISFAANEDKYEDKSISTPNGIIATNEQNNTLNETLKKDSNYSPIYSAIAYDPNLIYKAGDTFIINRNGNKIVLKTNYWTAAGTDPLLNIGGFGSNFTVIEDGEKSGNIPRYESGNVYTSGSLVIDENGKPWVANWWTRSKPTINDPSWSSVNSVKSPITVDISKYDSETTYHKGQYVSEPNNGHIYTYLVNSETVKGVSPKTSIKGANPLYIVVADNADSYSSNAIIDPDSKTATIDPQTLIPPEKVTNIVFSQLSQNKLSIVWDTPLHATSSVTYNIYDNGKLIYSNISGNSTIISVKPGEKHIFTIIASNSYGSSEVSNAFSYTTPISQALPDIPTLLEALSVSYNNAKLDWGDSKNATYYEIYQVNSSGEKVKIGTTTNSEYTLNNLTPNSKYTYEIKAINSTGSSDFSDDLTFTTGSLPANNNSSSAIPNGFDYSSAKDYESSKVYTSGDLAILNGQVYKAKWWTQNNSPLGIDSAVNKWDSPWEKVGFISDSAPNTPSLVISSVTPTSITINAKQNGDYVTYYHAIIKKDSDGTIVFEKDITSSSNISFTKLDPSTKYDIFVTAHNNKGSSDPADIQDILTKDISVTSASKLIFSPYVDTSLSTFKNIISDLEGTSSDNIFLDNSSVGRSVSFGFLQSDGKGGLGWGGTTALDGYYGFNNDGKYQDAINTLENSNIDVIVSFGGMAGTDPAVYAASHNQSASYLSSLFQNVLDTYSGVDLDFDVEGHAQLDRIGNKLRGEAIHILQLNDMADNKKDLTVSFTLPVLREGLVDAGKNVILDTIATGAKIDRVNIMAMDYGQQSVINNMGQAAIDAIRATEAQLDSLGLSDTTIGVIPMIGVNDVSVEIFTLDDARLLYEYIQTDDRVDLVSMWSLGRDVPGSSQWASAIESGLDQQKYDFSHIFQGSDSLTQNI